MLLDFHSAVDRGKYTYVGLRYVRKVWMQYFSDFSKVILVCSCRYETKAVDR